MIRKEMEQPSRIQCRQKVLAASMLAILALPKMADAMEIPTNDADISVRWDNTFRYNAGWRMQNPSTASRYASAIGTTDADAKFSKGSMVTDRLDLLSEFDFIYKKDSGFRVSAAAWGDTVYRHLAFPAAGGAFPGGALPDEVKRYYAGPSGEILDAFVFTKFNLGGAPVNLKLGQHTIYWGETLFSLADGVASGQSYVDLRKAVATPGAEAKEVFMPLNQLSFAAQVTSELTVMGQYYFDYKIDRFPLGGTYFTPADFLTYHGSTIAKAGLIDWNGENSSRRKYGGDWGLGTKWHSAWLDGTAGLYIRHYTPKSSAALVVDATNLLMGSGPASGEIFNDPAAPRTKLLGLSLSKLIGSISFGADLTYRKDFTLATKPFTFLGGPFNPLPGWAPIGNISTATINAAGYLGKTPLFDSAVLMAEFDVDHLNSLTRNAENFGGVANCVKGTSAFPAGMVAPAAYGPIPINGGQSNQGNFGCATTTSTGINVSFEPKWFQAWSGTDVTMPIFFSRGLHGNSVIPVVGQMQRMGVYSVGVTADVDAKYNIALKYNGQLYESRVGAQSGIGFSNGALGNFTDRNWLSLTLKATF